MMTETDTPLSLAAKLATSYVGNNKVKPAEIPALIGSLHEALSKLESGEEIREPAVPINKSVKREMRSFAWSVAKGTRCSSGTSPRHMG